MGLKRRRFVISLKLIFFTKIHFFHLEIKNFQNIFFLSIFFQERRPLPSHLSNLRPFRPFRPPAHRHRGPRPTAREKGYSGGDGDCGVAESRW
ncbi:hypothetical protein V6Z11_D10G107400 [Gossypium hirsutum]